MAIEHIKLMKIQNSKDNRYSNLSKSLFIRVKGLYSFCKKAINERDHENLQQMIEDIKYA